MANKIFLVSDSNTISDLVEQRYETEDDLQGLLEKWPELLAGDQMDTAQPRRWVMVKREMEVADSDESDGRWSLDHLLLDQSGILTLVEVKRSTDTRIRREVVGQMLDYAANAVVYWPFEQIRTAFADTCREREVDPATEIRNLLQLPEASDATEAIDAFWQSVKTNLAAERIRMVFVADVIPAELRRIVEFLNGQMDPAEVLAVELKQYVGAKGRTLVPRVMGQTARAEMKKSVKSRELIDWDEQSFMESCRVKDPASIKVVERLMEWFKSKAAGVRWGRGGTNGTFTGRVMIAGEDTELMRVFDNGGVQFALGTIPDSIAQNVREQLASIEGLQLSRAKQYPSGELETLADETKWRQFIAIFEGALQQLK